MMRRAWNKLIAVAVTGLFGVAALFCCYNHPAVNDTLNKKHSCCETKTSSKNSAKADGSTCPIVAKSVDVSKNFVLVQDVPSPFIYRDNTIVFLKPLHSIEPVFLNGPPGHLSLVPIYIKLHSLRV